MMVCEQDICTWFLHARGSERVRSLCSLLQLCTPLELRFLGTCVEDLAKKDFVSLREEELKSNDSAHLRTLIECSVFDDRTRSKLLFAVSLLYSLNTVCAHALYEVLGRVQSQLIEALDGTKDRPLDHRIAEDILLLFTMAANHPAFTFSERQQLYSMFKNVERLVSEFLVKVESPALPIANCVSPPGLSSLVAPSSNDTSSLSSSSSSSPHLLMVKCKTEAKGQPEVTNHNDCKPQSNDSGCSVLSSPCRSSHVKSISIKGSHQASNNIGRKTEYTILVTWSNGETTESLRTYQELHSFHSRLLKLYPEESSGHKLDRVLPFFPQDKGHHNSQQREVFEALGKYFRQLSGTHFVRSQHVTEFFAASKQLHKSSSSSSSSCSSSPALSVSSMKNKSHKHQQQHSASGQNSSLVLSSSPDVAVSDAAVIATYNSLPSDANFPVPLTEMPPGKSPLVPTGHVVPTKVTQRHAYSQPSSTRSPSPQHHNSPLTSPVPCRTSPWPHASREPLDLSMEEWLKKIRLHKYSSVLSKYNLAQLYQLTDNDLADAGLTQGAQRKLRSELAKLCEGLKNGLIDAPTPEGSSQPPPGLPLNWVPPPPLFPGAEVAFLQRTAYPEGMAAGDGLDSSPSCSEYSSPPHSPGANHVSSLPSQDPRKLAEESEQDAAIQPQQPPAESGPAFTPRSAATQPPPGLLGFKSSGPSFFSVAPSMTNQSYVEPKSGGLLEVPPPLPPPPPYAQHFPMRLPPGPAPGMPFMPRGLMGPRSPRVPLRPPICLSSSNSGNSSNGGKESGMKSSQSCPHIQQQPPQEATPPSGEQHYKAPPYSLMGTSLVSRPSTLVPPAYVMSSTCQVDGHNATPPLAISSTSPAAYANDATQSSTPPATTAPTPPTPRQTPPLTSTPSECTRCSACGHSRPAPPAMFTGGWPLPLPHAHPMAMHGAMPMGPSFPPTYLPNGVSPEVLYNNQANFVMQQHRPPPAPPLMAGQGAGLLGQHPMATTTHYPMHAPQPGLLMTPLAQPPTVFTKINKGPMCCNCGANGHRGTECKESTFDMMARSGQYHLNLAPKSESE